MKPLHLLAVFLLALAPLAQAQANKAPREIVQERTDLVLKALVDRRDEFRADNARLHDFIRSELDAVFDREYSARLVLARHSRTATDAQISAFAEALAENLMRRYGSALLEFNPEISVRVTGETPLRDGALMRVASEIQRRGQEGVPVHYMFRRVGDEWLMFDVIVEGVSYVQTYRSQFDELLRRQDIDQVTARLREGSLNVDG
jgi:phospholipid transport system substrate-binding protein